MKHVARLLAIMFALATASAWACPDEKAQDGSQQSTPKKPTTSLTTS